MAVSEHSHDPRRSVVVSNFPPDVGEDELTIHFQKPKNGGGDVDKVVVDGNVAFVIFDSPEGWQCFVFLLCLASYSVCVIKATLFSCHVLPKYKQFSLKVSVMTET